MPLINGFLWIVLVLVAMLGYQLHAWYSREERQEQYKRRPTADFASYDSMVKSDRRQEKLAAIAGKPAVHFFDIPESDRPMEKFYQGKTLEYVLPGRVQNSETSRQTVAREHVGCA